MLTDLTYDKLSSELRKLVGAQKASASYALTAELIDGVKNSYFPLDDVADEGERKFREDQRSRIHVGMDLGTVRSSVFAMRLDSAERAKRLANTGNPMFAG